MTHTPLIPTRHARQQGFTLMELLVVISILFGVMALTVPLLKTFSKDNAVTAGLNSMTAAAEATRQLAVVGASQKDPLADGGSESGGAAMLVTNTNEIRLLQKKNQPTWSGISSGNEEAVAFTDVAGRDYINLSPRTGIVGIVRNSSGTGGLALYAPPFAVRFNEHGSLIYGNVSSSRGAFNVYYDGDYNTQYNRSSIRSTPYDPDTKSWNNVAGRYEIPFERIGTVIGFIVFDRNLVPNMIGNGTNPQQGAIIDDNPGANTDPYDIILAHGTAVFFNRTTGTPVYRK